MNQSKDVFYSYLNQTNSLEKNFAKNIWNSITDFEERIVKITFYAGDKVKLITNFSKIYREFSHHWEKIANVNLRNLKSITSDFIIKEQNTVK